MLAVDNEKLNHINLFLFVTEFQLFLAKISCLKSVIFVNTLSLGEN